MKKVLSVALLFILCFAMVFSMVACGDDETPDAGQTPGDNTPPAGDGTTPGGSDTPAATATLADAKNYLKLTYQSDNGKKTYDNYTLIAQVKVGEVVFPVAWTCDNANITIAYNETTKLYDVTVPAKNETEVEYILTATISDAAGATDTWSTKRVLPVYGDKAPIVTAPVADVAYKLSMIQNNAGKTLYALNTIDSQGKYINTTTDPSLAADYYVEVVEGGFKFYTMVGEAKKYVEPYLQDVDGNASKRIRFVDATETVLRYSTDYTAWTVTLNGTDYCFGTYGDYTTVSISGADFYLGDKRSTQFSLDLVLKEDALKLGIQDATQGVVDPTELTTIPDALAIGSAKESGKYTIEKYLIQGVITEVKNTTYGNVIISDGTNSILVYGMYSADGSVRYDAMETKPVVGDTITVMGVLGQFNGTAQMKNGWLQELVPGEGGGDTPVDPDVPVDPTELTTIPDALAIGGAKDHNTYTTEKYLIQGVITEVQNTTYGNVIISDGTNSILVYGMYSADGSVRYDAMTTKPVVGDTVTLMGVLGQFNGTAQMKDGWLQELVPGEGGGDTPVIPDDPEEPADLVVIVPGIGEAFKIGMINTNKDNNVYYISGGMASTYYLATSTDVAAALDFYIEEADGGFYLYYLDGATKTYINVTVSGTHVNSVYETTASTVWTYDATLNTLTVDVEGEAYILGTRNDRNFTTVGPVMASSEPFYCQAYGEKEETPVDPDVPVLEGTGAFDDPYILPALGDYVAAFPGGYELVWYTITLNEGGNVTVSSSFATPWIKLGTDPMTAAFNEDEGNTLTGYFPAGAVVYIGVADWNEQEADVPFSVSFEAVVSDPIDNIVGTWNGSATAMWGSFNFLMTINADGTGVVTIDTGMGANDYTISYILVKGEEVTIGYAGMWGSGTFYCTYAEDVFTCTQDTQTGAYFVWNEGEPTPVVPETPVYDTVIEEGENNLWFSADEIAADSATRDLIILEDGTYNFLAGNLFVQSITDAEGNVIERNADYTYTLEFGEYTLTFGMLSMFSVEADTKQTLNVELITEEPGEEPGDEPAVEGTVDNPIVLPEMGDYVAAFPGGYNLVWYTITLNEGGNVTLTTAFETPWINLGTDPMTAASNEGNGNTLTSYFPAGAVVYIGVGDWDEQVVDVPFSVSFEAVVSDPIDNIVGTWNGAASNMWGGSITYTMTINADGTGVISVDDGMGVTEYAITYILVQGENVEIGIQSTWRAGVLYNTYVEDVFTCTQDIDYGTFVWNEGEPTPVVPETPVYDTVIVEGENNLWFSADEIAADSATRDLIILEDGNYNFLAGNLFVGAITDAEGNAIAKNDDYTYTLAIGEYTVTFASLSMFGVQADVKQELNVEVVVPHVCTEWNNDGTCSTKATCVECGEATGELAPDVHTFVDGACECGATEETGPITSIADALAAEEGAEVELTGTVDGIYEAWSSFNNMSVYITDGTSRILVFRTTLKCAEGDVITVTGTMTKYSNTMQVAQGSTGVIVTAHPCDWTDATCDAPKTCSVCGATEGEALGHNFVDGTCANGCGATESTGEETTVTLSIADYATANSWSNGVKYTSATIDENITATVAGTDQNSGKYYTSGNQWRLYQTGSATITITAAEGKTIKSVKITYASNNSGCLTYNGENVSSDTVVYANGSTITLTVGNTGSATNGQARITAIEVVYA